MSSGRRILSVWFKRLAVERIIRREKIPFGTPVIIKGNKKNSDIIYSLNRAAELEGLYLEQSINDALAKCPNVLIRFINLESDSQFLDMLMRWAEKFSPWIKTELPDGLLIDLTGCAHLFGGEELLIQTLKNDCLKFSLTVQISIADTAGAAWALSHFIGENPAIAYTSDVIDQEARATRSRAVKKGYSLVNFFSTDREENTDVMKSFIALPGEVRGAVACLPLAALRIPSNKVIDLRKLGLKYVKDLFEIPRAVLVRRFGKDVLRRLDQILGLESEPISPKGARKHFSVRLTLPEPIGLKADLVLALQCLVSSLCQKLKKNAVGARIVQLQVFKIDGITESVYVELARPSFDVKRIMYLLNMKVEEIKADFGIDLVRLEVKLFEPIFEYQYEKIPKENNFETKTPEADLLLDDLLSRIALKISTDKITRWHSAESHIPEKSFLTLSALWSEPEMEWQDHNLLRPTTLFNDEIILVEDQNFPPKKFKWRNRLFDTSSSVGPERISPEWWLDASGWRTGVRDYWRVNVKTGERLWLYYAYGGIKNGGWFCHGDFG